MRPVIQRVLEKQIKDSVNQLDAIIYDIKKEAEKAAEDAKRNPDPENLQNMYQRYASAANQRLMQGKQKKEKIQQRTKETQVNMAVTQHDSIFKDISLPGGISSKATEYKELAAKGEKWESPVFSIGSAKETSSLPKIAAVQRKPHGRPGGYAPQPGSGAPGSGLLGQQQDYESPYSQTTSMGMANTTGAGATGLGAGMAGMDGAYNQQANGGAAGANQSQYHTTLGVNNPVLQGNV